MGTRVFLNSSEPVRHESVDIWVSCKTEFCGDKKEIFVLATFKPLTSEVAEIMFSVVVENVYGTHLCSRNFHKAFQGEKFYGLQAVPAPAEDELVVKILIRKLEFR